MPNATFSWDDPFLLEQQLESDERAVRDAAQAYAQQALAPRILRAFREEHTDPAIFREMGELGLLGGARHSGSPVQRQTGWPVVRS